MSASIGPSHLKRVSGMLQSPPQMIASSSPPTKGLKALFLCPYPFGQAPGQRFRYEQYLGALREAGIEPTIAPFLPEFSARVLYLRGHFFRKGAGVIVGFLRRLWAVIVSSKFDWVFIFREAAPLGPPVIECLLFLLGRKVIYDFDDAIYLTNTSSANRFLAFLKWPSKVEFSSRHAKRVSVCNPHLKAWAERVNSDVRLIPTTIDPRYHHSSRADRGVRRPIVIGWTGTNTTAPYLRIAVPALNALTSQFDFEFRVICDIDPGPFRLRNYTFVRWRFETEISDLDAFDIGIMPVPDGEWGRGKVGFKAIQYSAMGIPTIASIAGSGPEVIEDGRTGFLVDDSIDSWTRAIRVLLADPDRIPTMGEAARQRILSRYSVPSQIPNYLALFSET